MHHSLREIKIMLWIITIFIQYQSFTLPFPQVPGSSAELESVGLVKSSESVRVSSGGNLRKSGNSLRPSMATLASLTTSTPPQATPTPGEEGVAKSKDV